jgi:glyoxylase-like metal-dependent hydrolase (beta-lactamase superfamily II)/8-oxo-dGTP pyrophosphatase MutT (NUDIX family)
MPGWYAFPGGAVHASDASVPATGDLGEPEGASVCSLPDHLVLPGDDLGPDQSRALAVAALRELWEETGVAPTARPFDEGLRDQGRRLLLEGPAALGPFLREHEAALDLSRLVWAGRWLTPPFAPLRFDNRFFLLEHHATDGEPHVVPGELVAGEWIAPAAALARWHEAEVLAAPPILHVLKVLAEEGVSEGALGRLRDPREADLGPMRRIEFRPGVIMIPLATPTLPPATHTNAYLIGGERVVLVDPGSPHLEEQERLLGVVEAYLAEGRTLHGIWLTHHHPDHVGGVQAAREALGAEVMAHQATAEMLRARGIPVERTLTPGETVELGGPRVTVHGTPGHAPGHLCFLEHDHGSLLVGDLVSALSTIVIDPPRNRMADYLDSLRRMADLEPRTLFPAHGPVVAPGEAALRHVVSHREERERRVLEAWQAGRRTPASILPLAYDDIPAMLHPLAERQIEAHLIHLEERGKIERS